MKKEVVAILLVAVVALILVFVTLVPKPVQETDARKFVLEDLWSKYPNADNISIISADPKVNNQSAANYFTIKARVTQDLYTPCPDRRHIYYNYPEQGFVKQPDEYITKGCVVCANQQGCILAFEEEAIIASHTREGTLEVHDYVAQYPDAKPSFALVPDYKGNKEVWLVAWDAKSAPYSYTVALLKSNASVVEVAKAYKPAQ
jgi:hypothetical protein